jgi:hypothetical protein
MEDPFGFDIQVKPVLKPYKISKEHFPILFSGVRDSLKDHARTLLKDDWKIYPVSQDTGWCNAYFRIITIPVWAITERPIPYKEWYIAHEFAHAFDMCKHKHGPEFMEWLKRICPNDVIHHELEYKPRFAAQAGIRKPLDI